MAVKIIYFVHGTTTDNLEHKSTGWIPGELSEKGIKQSIDLKKQISMEDIDLVISSDLKRAIDSANYTFKDIKDILHDERIRECNYGDLNGLDTSLVKYEEHIDIPFPNGESLKEVENRVRNFCNDLLEKYNGKTIAVVAHKAPQLALEVITKNITWDEAIDKDWRKTKSWQPGWVYTIENNENENIDLVFDKLKEEDLEEVAQLYDAERPMNTNRIKMKQTFNKIKDNPDYQMIVVKHNNTIVGFAKSIIHHDIFEENNPFMTIWSVRVKKDYRRHKIGTRLFNYIESIAKDMNCEFICLIAEKDNKSANEFYKKLNYDCNNGYVKILK